MSGPWIKDVQFAQSTVAANPIPNAAFATNPAAGDIIVVFVSAFASAIDPTPTAPTDTDGNTYTQIDTEHIQGSTIGLSVWICKNAKQSAGSCVVTGHLTNAGTGTIVAWLLGNQRNDFPYNNDIQWSNISSATATPITTPTTLNGQPQQSTYLAAMTPGGAGTFGFPNWNDIGKYGYQGAFSLRNRGTNNAQSQALYTQIKVADAMALKAQWIDSLGTDTWISCVLSFACSPNVSAYAGSDGVRRRTV